MIRIVKIETKDTYAIRKEVLRKNIPLPFMFNGDDAIDTFHLGAFKKDKLIAVSSYMKVENKNFKGNQYQLRGMATLENFQGLGAGKLMLIEAFKILKELNIECFWCNARLIAVKFYEKQGLSTFGEKFDVKLIGEHYVMYKYLNE
ncbi:GNAT family N-acetyltransferase [Lutibacter citreus]|uniref:GNAT family N-acetyltransferase n=1 Tax=Lutibacter citreus TaxID=2138210 RepID=UPI000DBEA4A2|nr:GNAT family N-acetyltransferase [Lutibacter citreus]